MKIEIRKGRSTDMKAVLKLIQELAVYEKSGDEVTNTVDQLIEDGFGEKKYFEVIVAEWNKEIVGFVLYFNGYSTWKGKTLYLEDFFVKENMRGKGVGKLLFNQVVSEARIQEVKRMDWQVLAWNKTAIEFYKKYGATLDEEWLNGKLFEKDLENLNF